MGLKRREETAWERRVRKLKETAFLGALIEGAETAAEAAGKATNRLEDRVFGETETSLCMGEIKRDDPNFNIQRFLKTLQNEMIPFVLQNYLENKLEPLEVLHLVSPSSQFVVDKSCPAASNFNGLYV